MENVENKVNKFLDKIQKDLKSGKEVDLVKTLEEFMLKNYPADRKQDYFKARDMFQKLKKEINLVFPNQLIAERIRELKLSGKDRPLTSQEEITRRYIILAIERQLLIIKVLSKLSTKEVKLSKISPDFDKYTLSNFYRTLCEITIRLFADTLFLIIDFLEKKLESNTIIEKDKLEENLKTLRKRKSRLMTYSFGLDDLRATLGSFEKEKNAGLDLIKTLDEYLNYKEGEGFYLRNETAHDKKLFSEMDNKFIIDQIEKVNMFNMAFIIVFYLDSLKDLMGEGDLDLSKQLFFD